MTAAFDIQAETDVDDYHADTSTVSKTMLNEYCTSPVQFDLMFNKKTLSRKKPTKEMNVGTILHSVLLEHKDIDEVVAVYTPDCFKKNGDLNPKSVSIFRESIGDKIAVKSSVLDDVLDCYKSIAKAELYDAIEAASEFETRHDADIVGVNCRCKPDIMCDMGEHNLIYDLKFCDPAPIAFCRSAKRFRYWLQDAHYSKVVSVQTGKPVQFRFFAVEPVFPFRVQCYWYGQREREISADYHIRKLRELRVSYDTDTWLDNWPNEMSLSPWDMGDTFEEQPLEGFDDE